MSTGVLGAGASLVSFIVVVGVAAMILPSLLVAPAFFLGAIQFGGLMQISNAFVVVQGAFSFFVVQYAALAEWKAVVDRLGEFETAVIDARAEAATSTLIGAKTAEGATGVRVEGLKLHLPDGTHLIAADPFHIAPGERVLVTGPTGSGKSTTFRAIGGIWPSGEGEVTLPADATVMVAPQRPYLPVGPLAAAIAFPAPPEAWPAETLAEALTLVGLGHFARRLDEAAHWDRRLSLGEQQRIGMARVLLHAPQYLFLDEATASLDEPSEAMLYQLIRKRLPGTTVVSIGHRSGLSAFHERRLIVIRDGEGNRLVEDRGPQAVAAASGR